MILLVCKINRGLEICALSNTYSCPDDIGDEVNLDEYGFLATKDADEPFGHRTAVPNAWVEWKTSIDEGLESSERLNQWIIDAFITNNSKDCVDGNIDRTPQQQQHHPHQSIGRSQSSNASSIDPHRPRRFSVSTIGSASSLMFSEGASSVDSFGGNSSTSGEASDATTVETVSTETAEESDRGRNGNKREESTGNATSERLGFRNTYRPVQNGMSGTGPGNGSAKKVWYSEENASCRADLNSLPQRRRARENDATSIVTGFGMNKEKNSASRSTPPPPPLPKKKSAFNRSSEDLVIHLTPNQDFLHAKKKQRNRKRENYKMGFHYSNASISPNATDTRASNNATDTNMANPALQDIMKKIMDDVSLAGDCYKTTNK